jgi:hypothetical protein
MALVFLVTIVAGNCLPADGSAKPHRRALHLLKAASSRLAFDNSNFEHVSAEGNDARQCFA